MVWYIYLLIYQKKTTIHAGVNIPYMDGMRLFCWKLDIFSPRVGLVGCQYFFEVRRYSSKIIFIVMVFAGRRDVVS